MGSGKSYRNLLISFYLALTVSFILGPADAKGQSIGSSASQDTAKKSVLKLQDVSGIPWESQKQSPLFLKNPSNIKEEVVYDPDKNEYVIYKKSRIF